MKLFKNKLLIMMLIAAVLLVAAISITSRGRTSPSGTEKFIGGVLSTVSHPLYSVGQYFSESFSNIFNFRNILKENDILKEEINKLREQNRQLYQMAIENKRLRTLLNYKEGNSQCEYIVANICGKDIGNWFDTFTIDKGTKDGVKVNDAILSGQGLIGRIIEVGDTYSKVISIIDERSSTSIIVNRTRDIGIASGSTESTLTAIMPLEADIVKGDDIITSSFSTYEKGLYIGKVKSVSKEEQKLHKVVIIEPAADFLHIEEVFVLKEGKE